MKKILIISDTHGQTSKAHNIIEETDRIDLIIHAGDFAKDAEDIECIYPNIPICYVCGNCDYFSTARNVIITEAFDKRFFITHGHGYNVKSEVPNDYPTITKAGKEHNADIIVFGHTHIPYIGYSGKSVIINPGSLKYTGSYVICTIDGDKVSADTFYL